MAGLPGAVLNRDTMSGLHRRTIRSQVNPYDKATIFSILPFEVKATHYTTEPSDYLVPAGSPENPIAYVVGPASWWRDFDPEQPLLEIRVSALQVAESIVMDYIKARIGVGTGATPGIFYLPGEISVEELQAKYVHLLLEAIEKQNRWFKELINMADVDWARSNGNPLVIDDTARHACKALSQARDWMGTFRAVEMIACVACGQLRNPKYPICPHCKNIVDVERAKELKLKFAQ